MFLTHIYTVRNALWGKDVKYDFATETILTFIENYSKEMTKGIPDKGAYTIQKII